jgi:hypothetical protein
MGPTFNSSHQRTFLLRVWREPGAPQPLRCSLEDPQTRQRRGFDSIEGLTAFLASLASREPTADRQEQ